MHIENVIGLHLGERNNVAACGGQDAIHQRRTGCAAILAGPNRGDDLVDQVEGLHQAFDNVQPLLGLIEAVLRAASDDLDLVIDIGHKRIAQVEGARYATNQRNHVDAETRLQRSALPQVVQHNFGVRIALQGNDEASFIARRFIVHVRDAVDLVVTNKIDDLAGHCPGRDLVRESSDHDLLALSLFA